MSNLGHFGELANKIVIGKVRINLDLKQFQVIMGKEKFDSVEKEGKLLKQ